MRHYTFLLKSSWKRPDKKQGQTIVETAILLMIIVFAFIAMQTYLKRGIQGRIRANIDSIGEQYDPEKTTSDYTVTHVSNSTTITTSAEEAGTTTPVGGWGYWTTGNRIVTSVETQTHYDNTVRSGYEHVEAP